MAIMVRWLEEEEWPILRSLRLHALADAPAAFGGPGIDAERAEPEAAWRARFENADWLVATDSPDGADAHEVGLLSLVPRRGDEASTGWIYAWWIDPSARRRGATTAMLTAVDERSRQRGWTSVGLGTFPDNEKARRAFHRLGFIAGPQQRGTLPPYPDFIPMARPVSRD